MLFWLEAVAVHWKCPYGRLAILKKVGILYGKQMIPSQSRFPLRQTFSFLTEGTKTVLMEGITPDFTNSPVVWSTTNWSVCVKLLCSKQVPAQPASQHCLLLKDHCRKLGGGRLLQSATVHWENAKCVSKTAVLHVPCAVCTQEEQALHGDKLLRASLKGRYDTIPVCPKEDRRIFSPTRSSMFV